MRARSRSGKTLTAGKERYSTTHQQRGSASVNVPVLSCGFLVGVWRHSECLAAHLPLRNHLHTVQQFTGIHCSLAERSCGRCVSRYPLKLTWLYPFTPTTPTSDIGRS